MGTPYLMVSGVHISGRLGWDMNCFRAILPPSAVSAVHEKHILQEWARHVPAW